MWGVASIHCGLLPCATTTTLDFSTGIFGQSSDPKTEGDHSSRDVDAASFDMDQAFGSSIARVEGLLPTMAKITEAKNTCVLRETARSPEDIKRAYYRQAALLRLRLKRTWVFRTVRVR